MNIRAALAGIFPRVTHPQEYLGGELNSVLKTDFDVHVALAFPDRYIIGMSNLGIQILYTAMNGMDGVFCERSFAVSHEMEALLREKDVPLFSLESQTPLAEFDIIGFSLQYEMLYTNVLAMLSLARIPLRSADRNGDMPIIIAGGPCAYNPLPLAPFIDIFLVGEFDSEIRNFVSKYRALRKAGTERDDIIRELAQFPYAYAPRYHEPGRIIRKQIEHDLENAPYPERPLIPNARTVQERVVVEISRGCTHNCRFCSAGIIFRPLRHRSAKRIVEMIRIMTRASGYDEVNLSSLSADDYPNIRGLVEYVSAWGNAAGFSLTLPSLRIDSFDRSVADRIATFKKTGLTFALEAGDANVRAQINKEANAEDVLAIAKEIQSLGWRLIKLYFMIGFTDDLQKEADAITLFLNTLRTTAGRGVKINVSINAFIPKPHTPMQFLAQADHRRIAGIIGTMRDSFRHTNVFLKTNPYEMSHIEGVLARGDERIADAVEHAFNAGARFDAWGEHFSLARWEKAFADAGIDTRYYLGARTLDAVLPWDFISTGVSREHLNAEYRRSLTGEITPDCRTHGCHACGLEEGCAPSQDEPIDLPPPPEAADIRADAADKVFVRYTRTGNARFLGHFDVKRLITNAFTISGISLAYSKGFSPKPLIAFTDPLPFGVESEAEYCEAGLRERCDIERLMLDLNELMPETIRIAHIERIGLTERRIGTMPKNARFRFHTGGDTALIDALAAIAVPAVRTDSDITLDLASGGPRLKDIIATLAEQGFTDVRITRAEPCNIPITPGVDGIR
ncbi:MAG: TIGR03960 family B12-binding radical SAM protein [Spirochaetota bacterium]